MANNSNRSAHSMLIYVCSTFAILAAAIAVDDCVNDSADEGSPRQVEEALPAEAPPAPSPAAQPRAFPPHRTPRGTTDLPRDEKPVPDSSAEEVKTQPAAHPCPSTPVRPARMRYAYEMLVEHIKARNERNELDRVNGSVHFGFGPPPTFGYTATPDMIHDSPVIRITAKKRGGGYWIGNVNTGCLVEHHPFARSRPLTGSYDEVFLYEWDPLAAGVSSQGLKPRHAAEQVKLATLIDELIAALESNPP